MVGHTLGPLFSTHDHTHTRGCGYGYPPGMGAGMTADTQGYTHAVA